MERNKKRLLQEGLGPVSRNRAGSEESHSESPELWNIDGAEVDLNATYTVGGQLWYLQDRAKEQIAWNSAIAGRPMNAAANDARRLFSMGDTSSDEEKDAEANDKLRALPGHLPSSPGLPRLGKPSPRVGVGRTRALTRGAMLASLKSGELERVVSTTGIDKDEEARKMEAGEAGPASSDSAAAATGQSETVAHNDRTIGGIHAAGGGDTKKALRKGMLATTSASNIADDVTLQHSNAARHNWKKVKTDMVVETVLTQQLAVEHSAQVQRKFEFLVKDYQPKYYYFECVFLVEKLILTGLLIFVPPGTIAQAYVATLTAFVFCVIQTKYMPYDALKDNLLKQLCEVQLLMTLLISIILRTDLEDDLISEYGYDVILVAVNSLMVPAFITIAAVGGLIVAVGLIYELYQKKMKIKRRQTAFNEKDTAKLDLKEQEIRAEVQREAKKKIVAAQERERRRKIKEKEDKQKRRKEVLKKDRRMVAAMEIEQVMKALNDEADAYNAHMNRLVTASLKSNRMLLDLRAGKIGYSKEAYSEVERLQALLKELQDSHTQMKLDNAAQIMQLTHAHEVEKLSLEEQVQQIQVGQVKQSALGATKEKGEMEEKFATSHGWKALAASENHDATMLANFKLQQTIVRELKEDVIVAKTSEANARMRFEAQLVEAHAKHKAEIDHVLHEMDLVHERYDKLKAQAGRVLLENPQVTKSKQIDSEHGSGVYRALPLSFALSVAVYVGSWPR